MNLFVNVQANIANFMAGIAQMKTAVQGLNQQIQNVNPVPINNLGQVMQLRNTLVGAAAAVDGLATAFDGLTLGMVKSFASQETAFAGVRKTLNETEEGFAELKAGLIELSNRTPVKFEDLAKIEMIAGQLGVRGTENLTKFTETVARIAVSTNLTAEEAAIGFARLSAVMKEPIENVDHVASAVVALGKTLLRQKVKFSTSLFGSLGQERLPV